MSTGTTKRPEIAFYLHSLNIGGAERVAVRLARTFVKLGFQVDFVLVQATGPFLSDLPPAVRVIDLGAVNAVAGFPALVRYIRSHRPRVILSTAELTSLLVLIARFFVTVKPRIIVRLAVNISQHKRSPLKKYIERRLVSLLYPGADGIVAVSQNVADDFCRYTAISPEKVTVIYNPVITETLQEQMTQPLEHSFFRPDQPPVVLGVGRLSEQKDFGLLIKSFALVRKQMNARLLILGEGDERPRLEQLIRTLHLESCVELPGFSTNPYPYMSRASVFVLSSRWEGLPNVLIEAVACGAPAVSTDCPSGPAEILDGGRYGHLVPVGDVDALAGALEASLMGDHRKPPASWLEQFDAAIVAEKYLKVFGLIS